VSYSYDQGGQAACANGHLTTVTSGSQAYTRGYDCRGRVQSSTQSGYPAMSYTYFLNSALHTFTFPSGRQQTITYDNEGRANGVTGMQQGASTTYISALSYWPNGTPQQITTGAASPAAIQQFCQNNRQQITGIVVAGTAVSNFNTPSVCATPAVPSNPTLFLRLSYGTTGANSGNLSSEQIVTSSVNVRQNFTYDAYNRLRTANEINNNAGGAQGWAQSYLMDALGNRALDLSNSTYIPNPDQTPEALSQFSNNQWSPGVGYAYDGGNQTSTGTKNSPGIVANTYSDDAEGRVITANIAGTGNVTYSYDGEGRRTQKNVGGVVTNFVYDSTGALVAEYSTNPAPATGTQYLFADHLGVPGW